MLLLLPRLELRHLGVLQKLANPGEVVVVVVLLLAVLLPR